jgi:hypothetical protein
MGTLYIDTGGSATNSGSTDSNSRTIGGTNATYTSGTATITLPAGTDLTNVNATAGSATQDTIYLSTATNTNQKIFWIIGKAGSGGATPTVTTSINVTGTGTNDSWSIGGRHVLTNATIEGALRAGDTVTFNNSPAAQAATVWTFRNAGDTTSGFAKIKGAAGVRPVLTANSTNITIADGGLAMCWIENLEIAKSGASGNAITVSGGGNVIYNVKVSSSSAVGIQSTSTGGRIIGCEVTGTTTQGINTGVSIVYGNYVHDCTTDGIACPSTNATIAIVGNIVDTCGGRGIYIAGGPAAVSNYSLVLGNTVYGCGNSGIEVTDAESSVTLFNNIFQDNGDAAGEFNAEWAAGAAEFPSFHAYNIFSKSSNNLSGLTANAQVSGTESTADPLLFNPASADFRLKPGSPGKGTAFPGTFLGITPICAPDLGAFLPAMTVTEVSVGGRSGG